MAANNMRGATESLIEDGVSAFLTDSPTLERCR